MNDTTRAVLNAYVELYKLAPAGILPPIEEQATLPLVDQCKNLMEMADRPECSDLAKVYGLHLMSVLHALVKMQDAWKANGGA